MRPLDILRPEAIDDHILLTSHRRYEIQVSHAAAAVSISFHDSLRLMTYRTGILSKRSPTS